MRTFFIILLIIVYVVVTLPALLVFYLISRKDPKKAERGVHVCMSWLLRSIKFIAGTKLIVSGLENVPSDRPVLYISNHTSYFDIIFTYPLCSLPTAYVAKSDLQKIPFFSIWGTLMRCLFFDRNNAKSSVQMIVDGTNNLKTDTSVYIFPEGKRNKSETGMPLNTFHDGSFKMAQRSGAPVIPVAIKTGSAVWEAHMPWVHKTTVKITYGRPIYIKELSADDQKHIGSYMQKQIENMLLNS
jgi:1-acyl-sn-glycerol-3-phosphate acyltransferase